MDIVVSDGAAREMRDWYLRSKDGSEMTRELLTRLLQRLGVWCTTAPLRDLAILLTKGKIIYYREDAVDMAGLHAEVTEDGLGVATWTKRLQSLTLLSFVERQLIINECRSVCVILDEWLWMPNKTETQEQMYALIRDASFVLHDIDSFLSVFMEHEGAAEEFPLRVRDSGGAQTVRQATH